MRELVEQIIGYLPRYLADLAALIAGPKQFIWGKHTESDAAYNEGLFFSCSRWLFRLF
jgi:hypothetical protein